MTLGGRTKLLALSKDIGLRCGGRCCIWAADFACEDVDCWGEVHQESGNVNPGKFSNEPQHPFGGGQFDLGDVAPWALAADDAGFKEPLCRFWNS
jgi:hypothetical protein